MNKQQQLSQDEVYHQVKTLLDGARYALEISVSSDGRKTAVRVRDLEKSRLLGYGFYTQTDVLKNTKKRQIFPGPQPDYHGVNDAEAATFAAVARTLIDALPGTVDKSTK